MARKTVTVDENELPAAPAPEEVTPALTASDGTTGPLDEPRKNLTIFNGSGAEGSQPVAVQVNGKAYLIPRETKVSAPISVISVLNNAVETHFFLNPETKSLEPKDVRRFNFIVE